MLLTPHLILKKKDILLTLSTWPIYRANIWVLPIYRYRRFYVALIDT